MNQGIMLNIDDTHFAHSRWKKGIRPGRAELEAFVAQYEGTQVTDLMLDVAGRIAGFPSRIKESWVDKYLQKQEQGQPVDYADTLASVMYDLYVNQGLDPYAIWIEQARRSGIRPWISIRMNDCHDTIQERSLLHSNFYHEHPELRRVVNREPEGYFDRCLNYAEEAVRERMLAFIDEVLERYDPDGLELDWQREVFCFSPGEEYRGVEVLNGFMRTVVEKLRAAAKRRGHEVQLCVRVPADPEDALEMGFDVAQWAREGLVQVVVPTPRWRTCDTDMPIGLWKRLLAGTGVLLAPGIEILIQPGQNARFFTSAEHVAALAAQHFALGGDRTYLYNYFDDPIPEDTYWNGNVTHPDMAVRADHQRMLLENIGDPQKAAQLERRHVVTERDLRPIWRKTEQPLPFECEEQGRFHFLRVCVGEIPAGAAAEVTLGLAEGCIEDVRLYVQHKMAAWDGQARELRPEFVKHPVYAFPVEHDGQLPPYLVLELTTTGAPFTVDYVDVHIR